MNTRNALAMYCHCSGPHVPGCELLLWLTIKYGDKEIGVEGVAELEGPSACLSPEAVEMCDTWYERLHDLWVSEKRLHLSRAECGWIDEWKPIKP